MEANELMAGLRKNGWMVAVHNDYRLNGEGWTFYLFTHPCGIWAKGEGKTDQAALQLATTEAIARMVRLRELAGDELRLNEF